MHPLSLPFEPRYQYTPVRETGPLDNQILERDLYSPYYGYLPTEWTSLLFVILYTGTTASHLIQAARYRNWWLIPTAVLAGFGEILGWACRIWSHYEPLELDPYIIQTIVLVISPTFLIGALFITFGKMTAVLGQQYSRLSPRLYARIFFTSDFGALVVQSIGGGIAASSRAPDTMQLGNHIILAGVSFQLASLTVFSALLVEYVMRCFKDQPHALPSDESSSDSTLISEASWKDSDLQRTTKPLVIGICLETALLYVRAVYRTVELAGGWNGEVIRTERLFVVFDGAMVFLVMLAFNIYHPGRILGKAVLEEKCPETQDIP